MTEVPVSQFENLPARSWPPQPVPDDEPIATPFAAWRTSHARARNAAERVAALRAHLHAVEEVVTVLTRDAVEHGDVEVWRHAFVAPVDGGVELGDPDTGLTMVVRWPDVLDVQRPALG